MTNDNAAIQAERARQQAAFDDGMAEGYWSVAQPLPRYWYEKTLAMLTARERGFWYGRQLRIREDGEHVSNTAGTGNALEHDR